MRLRKTANRAISRVNENITATLITHDGYTIDAQFRQVPNLVSRQIRIQLQALSETELRHMDALNITGQLRSVHVDGEAVTTMIRADRKSAAEFVFDNQVWQVVHVLEQWSDWARVVICRQS